MTKALDWRKLPDLVFNDVMLIVGHQSIEDLDKTSVQNMECHDYEQDLGEPNQEVGDSHTKEDREKLGPRKLSNGQEYNLCQVIR